MHHAQVLSLTVFASRCSAGSRLLQASLPVIAGLVLTVPVFAQDAGRVGERLQDAPKQPKQPPLPPPAAVPADALVTRRDFYQVWSFRIVYAMPAKDELQYFLDEKTLPSPEELSRLSVDLVRTPEGYVAPEPGVVGDRVRVTIGEVKREDELSFDGSALGEIHQAIYNALRQRDIAVVEVRPNEEQIEKTEWRDMRPDEDRSLVIEVMVGQVGQVRTIASGSRFASSPQSVDLAAHRRIREGSPIKGGLMFKSQVQDYCSLLNRYPSRRVDAAIGPMDDPGKVTLDYLVYEDKPWNAYFQLENTGTKQTNEWRERLGFTHYQLTGADDTLRLDYLTAGFEDTHSFTVSYDRPVGQRVRARVYGSYDEYLASDVAVDAQDYRGSTGEAGAELVFNVLQQGSSFFDVFAGARYDDTEVRQTLAGAVNSEGQEDFLLPYAGASFTRDTALSSLRLAGRLETQVLGTDQQELNRLGRIPVDGQWTSLLADADFSFFLEPLFAPSRFEGKGLASGQSWQPGMTLAHELVFRGQMQYVFDNRRVTPNYEQVAGGLYSVRGYPESVVAGDNVYAGTVEYRFHVPKALRPYNADTVPAGFRWRTDRPYGSADWDLILRAFSDAASVQQNSIQNFEADSTLWSAGVGIELQVVRSFRGVFRVDWGYVLNPVEDASGEVLADEGDNRFHFSFTLMF